MVVLDRYEQLTVRFRYATLSATNTVFPGFPRYQNVLIEVKYAEDGDLQKACEKALKQIESRHYEEVLKDEGLDEVLRYGVAFCKKRCRVMKK